jgi:glycosyltransferase involved in cell wall biosynthesis
MKVAVYTIAKNEEQFVDRWYDSAKDADYIYIADTGSTDKTIKLAKKLGIKVIDISISPWRFDDARNAALAAIPLDADYCIALDMDEVLIPGWKEELQKAHAEGWTRPRYKYTWSWKEDGTPGLEYGGDKIHARKGYRWKHPVHEVLVTNSSAETQGWLDLQIHHHPDSTKSRGQYFDLLKLSVQEDPHDDRNAFYYARELFFYNQLNLAAQEFKRYLALPTALWNAERARAYRYLAQCEPSNTQEWLHKAIDEDPNRREALVDLSMYYYNNHMWEECNEYAKESLEIKNKPLDYLCEEFAWGSLPHDLVSISAYNLGYLEEAITYAKLALEIDPHNQRLLNNLKHYNEIVV